MKKPGSPIRGSLFLTGGRLVSSLSGLVLVWLIGKRGPADLGAFRTIFSFFLITELFPLLGLQIYLMREIALHSSQTRKYLLHSVAFALIVSVFVAGVLLVLSRWGGYSEIVSKGLVVITGGMPATALYVCAVPILIGLEKGATIGLLQAVETLVRTLLGAAVVLAGGSILGAIASLVAVRWLMIFFYWKSIRPPPLSGGWKFEAAFFCNLLNQVPVFAGITVFAAVTRFAAPLMLPWMLNDAAAGYFGASYVFVDIALLLPTALIANLMPRLSVLARKSIGNLSRAAQEGIKLMALTMLPLAGLITLLAQHILPIVFRNPDVYTHATLLLRIGIWICFLMSLDQVLSSTIVACGKQSLDLKSVAIGAIATLAALYGAISVYGASGAPLGLVAGYSIQLITRFFLFARHVPGLNPLPLIWRPVIATATMMTTMIWIPAGYWLLGAPLGLGVYLGVLGILGALRASECEGIGLLLRTGKTNLS